MKERVRSLTLLTLTSKCIFCYCIVRQQLETDNERLTSDKTDLLSRLQCYEEDIKTANKCKT